MQKVARNEIREVAKKSLSNQWKALLVTHPKFWCDSDWIAHNLRSFSPFVVSPFRYSFLLFPPETPDTQATRRRKEGFRASVRGPNFWTSQSCFVSFFVLSRQTVFFFSSASDDHQLNWARTVASPLVLGLVLKQYPSNMQQHASDTHNNHAFLEFEYTKIVSKRKAMLALVHSWRQSSNKGKWISSSFRTIPKVENCSHRTLINP